MKYRYRADTNYKYFITSHVAVLRIRIRDEFFQDPGSRGYRVFLRILVLLFFLLIKIVPETIRSKKKVGFIFHPSF
jgi:hypothetical protein